MAVTAIDPATTDALIDAVRRVARTEILPRFRHPELRIDTKTSAQDLVTEADLAMERALAAPLTRLLPEARLIGEEAAASDPSLLDGLEGPGLRIILDPIDGTWNFANSLAHFGTALAIVKDGVTVFGLLYDPVLDDWIMAHKGGGVWFNRAGGEARRIGFSQPANGGFLHIEGVAPEQRAAILNEMETYGRTSTLQCSVHEYRTLLLGQAGFSLNAGLAPWDHLGGQLAVEEAGGVARLLDGRPYGPGVRRGRLLVARDETAWQRLQASLAPHLVASE